MVLYKTVNGVRVQCSESEEASIMSDWDIGRDKLEQQRIEFQREAVIKQDIIEKMKATFNLNDEEKIVFSKFVF
jgi:hypothetical protein